MIAHTLENVGKSGLPCTTCGEPHVLRVDPWNPRRVTWAAEDGHAYIQMSAERYWRERAERAEKTLLSKAPKRRCAQRSGDRTGRCVLTPRHKGEHIFDALVDGDQW